MPTYEMPLLLRIMKKPDLVTTLKRTTGTIFNTGGIVRKMENWGVKDAPYKISNHGHVYRQANTGSEFCNADYIGISELKGYVHMPLSYIFSHFCIYFDAPPKLIDKILDECIRDVDIVKVQIFKQFEPVEQECTFHEEMLPPPYRPSVQKLIEMSKNQHRNKQFQYNSGLDYYPFKR